jgi:hypothetical protein
MRKMPLADLKILTKKERLFCQAFGWLREGNSAASYGARDATTGERYQIKARLLSALTGSRQLSALRNLSNDPFDVLAGVSFNSDFTILRAALIPIALVKDRTRHSSL